MFRRLPEAGAASVPLTIDGSAVMARAGDSVAGTLIGAGLTTCRTTPVSGSPRGPFCMMGVCFDCMVEIDGRPNQQACMIEVRAGMRVARQEGARAADSEAVQ
jgi:predicted molibdopterin-dependent oxidoreductase YjgC